MLLVIFTETKRRGGCVSQEGPCAGWVVEWPLGSSPQRHWGATGALQPLTSVGTFCWAPGEGSPLPEWGMGERRALAPLKTLPREVRAETEGLLFLLSLGSVSLETGGETARRCGLPGPPKEGASGAQGSVLVGRLGSLGAEGM